MESTLVKCPFSKHQVLQSFHQKVFSATGITIEEAFDQFLPSS